MKSGINNENNYSKNAKNNIIIVIKTFPTSLEPKKKCMASYFVILKCKRAYTAFKQQNKLIMDS